MKCEAALLLILSAVTVCWGNEVIKRLAGSNVTFKAELSGRHTEINWFKGSSRIVDLEEGKPPDFYILKDRVTADLRKATLTLMSVTPADSGEYKAELLVGGQLSPVSFNLQVLDHVCQVVIRNTTVGNNVTLLCVCSDRGATPAQHQWYNGSKLVSDKPEITVEKQKEEQKYWCEASNDVSTSDVTFTVPALPPDPRAHVAAIVTAIVIVLLLLIGGFVCYRYKRRLLCINVATGPKAEENLIENVHRNRAPGSEEENKCLLEDDQQTVATGPKAEENSMENFHQNKSPCCCINLKLPIEKDREICITKAKKLLMKMQRSELIDLKRCRVQRGQLKIKDVVDGDYGPYTAEVHSSTGEPTTYRFQACKPAQNQENGTCNDASVKNSAQIQEKEPCNDASVIKLVSPLGGDLNLQIPNAGNAKTVTWRKDKDVLLSVTCDPDPLLETLELCEGTLCIQPVSSDNDGRYQVAVGDVSDRCIDLEMNISVTLDPGKEKKETGIQIEILEYFHPAEVNASDLANITFYPEIKEKAETITWKKDGENVAQWKEEAETITWKKDGENVAQCKEEAETITRKKDGENVAQCKEEAETITRKKDGKNVAQCKEEAETITRKKDGENVAQLKEEAKTITGKKDGENVAQWKEEAETITGKKVGENVAQCKEEAETITGKKDGENVAQCKEEAETITGKKDGENVAQCKEEAETITGKKDGENVAQCKEEAETITGKKDGENVAQCKEEAETITGKKDGENVAQLKENAKTITWKKDGENVAQWKEKDPIPKNCPLDPMSGNLTISNLKEEDQGRYIMEAQSGEQTIIHEFILSYSIKGLTKKL